jgi:two-component system LytT family response regulator
VIRTVIVDDEELARINLRYALSAHANWQIVAECPSAASAREILVQEKIDVLFLDIHMPMESGISLAKTVCAMSEPPLIIFVTAFEQYALDAFECYALDYLLKPFSNKRLAQTLSRAASLLAPPQRADYSGAMRTFVAQTEAKATGQAASFWTQILVRGVGTMASIQLDEISHISAAGNYVELHLAKRVVLYRQTISRMEQVLNPLEFMRVHRASIVRVSQCAQLTIVGDGVYELSLRCGDKIPVSERYVKALREKISLP